LWALPIEVPEVAPTRRQTEKEPQMPMPPVPVRVTSWDRKNLRRLVRSSDGRVVRRAQVILLARRGRPVREIGSLTGFTEEAVRMIKHRWNERGEDALRDAPRSGRPPRVTAEYRKRLAEAVRKGPAKFGYAFSVWTTARLAEHMARKIGIRIGPDRLRQILHELKMSWTRPAHTTRNLQDREEHERVRKRLLRLKRGLDERVPGTSSGSRTRPSLPSCRTSQDVGGREANRPRFRRLARTRSA
jgi:transposase